MGRGSENSEIKKQEKALALAAKFLGIDVSEVEAEVPTESTEDKLSEVEAVIRWHETRGEGFKQKACRNCGLVFAYSWNRSAISICSVQCAKEDLEKIGIKWNPHKTADERWGKTAPLVVPPEALQILQEDLLSETIPEELKEHQVL
jgi:hypothetical protein